MLNKKHIALENKVNKLQDQNEEFLSQNQQLMNELLGKTDYAMKLESLLFIMLELLVPKTQNNNKKLGSDNTFSNIIGNALQSIL
jgi:hypothetical protein